MITTVTLINQVDYVKVTTLCREGWQIMTSGLDERTGAIKLTLHLV
jgi:hypothetical protein